MLGNYAKFARFASINYNNNNTSSPAAAVVVVIVFVGLRRLWHLFLKSLSILALLSFAALRCVVGCFGLHLLPLALSVVGSVD